MATATDTTIDAKRVAPDESPAPMSHRQVLEAISGLLLGMFVTILSSTVVSTSLPQIVSDLKGNETAYTWVVTSTLLATTVSTPIWGKLADLYNRKLLLQIALSIFVIGSAIAGFSQNTDMLIGFRVLQGLGAGGLTALSQIVLADIISPRERGRYSGLLGGVMAIGMIGGPLVGGLITDSIGWRWTFFVGVPVALVALVLLQRTLKLPRKPKRAVSIDYAGVILLTVGVSLLLIWVSLAGNSFEWASWQTVAMVGGSVVALALLMVVEFRAKEPIIPLSMFKNRTFTLAVLASLSVGVAMFGTSVFLSQYNQLARGATPTQSGLLTIPMIVGLMGSSIVVGNLISRFGKWKPFMVVGSILVLVGLGLMGTLRYDTSYVLMSVYMFVLGAGIGMVMQNLVLVTQNAMPASLLGASSSSVTFFRSLGGTIGVSVMGSILATRVADLITDGVTSLGAAGAGAASSLSGGTIPQVSTLPEPIRTIVESAYGEAVGNIFLIAAPLAIVTIIAVALLPNKPLGTKNALEKLAEENGSAAPAEVERAEAQADARGTAEIGIAGIIVEDGSIDGSEPVDAQVDAPVDETDARRTPDAEPAPTAHTPAHVARPLASGAEAAHHVPKHAAGIQHAVDDRSRIGRHSAGSTAPERY